MIVAEDAPRRTVRIAPCGDRALTAELGEVIDSAINAEVIALEEALRHSGAGVVETVPTYRALLVTFDPAETTYDDLSAHIRTLAAREAPSRRPVRHWRIPVVYGGEFGIDLDSVASQHGMSRDDLIERHSSVIYSVYMIGFVPGFAYLGGLDPGLATPRLAVPRRTTPSGSISIGGLQASVASIEAPSGWHLLGRTPVRVFMAGRDPVNLLEPGDRISFAPITEKAWRPLALAAHAGEIVADRLA